MRLPITSSLTSARRVMSSTSKPSVPLLLSAKELLNYPNRRDLVALDVSWHMPNSPRNANDEYQQGPRIPEARRLDLDKVADLDPKTNPFGLGHMLPTVETFRSAVGKLGITPFTHVVLYDTVGTFASPRGLFTFKAFGHDKVSILDGGLPAWIDEGGDVEEGPVEVSWKEEKYDGGELNKGMVKSYADMVSNSKKGGDSCDVVLDARPTGRFTGQDPEPRPGMPSGHIPGSHNLPFVELLDPVEDGHPYTSYKSPEELREVLVDAVGGEKAWEALLAKGANAAGAVADRKLVFTCGSGMTACVGWLAAQIVAEKEGRAPPPAAIYDESWTGYGSRKDSEVAKGDA